MQKSSSVIKYDNSTEIYVKNPKVKPPYDKVLLLSVEI